MPSTAATTPIWLTLEYASTAFGWRCVRPIATRVERGHEARRGEHEPPVRRRLRQRQEADQADDADLDHGAAQHGRGRHRRRRVRERHPDVHRHEAGLGTEAGDEQRQDQVTIRRVGERRGRVVQAQAVAWDLARQHHEPHEQHGLGEQREHEVDRARAPGLRRLVVDHEAARAERQDREHRVQAHEIARDEHAEATRARHQPAGDEAAGLGRVAHVGRGIGAGRAPQQRRDAEQQRARAVEFEDETQPTGADLERRRSKCKCRGRERGQGASHSRRGIAPRTAPDRQASSSANGAIQVAPSSSVASGPFMARPPLRWSRPRYRTRAARPARAPAGRAARRRATSRAPPLRGSGPRADIGAAGSAVLPIARTSTSIT